MAIKNIPFIQPKTKAKKPFLFPYSPRGYRILILVIY